MALVNKEEYLKIIQKETKKIKYKKEKYEKKNIVNDYFNSFS